MSSSPRADELQDWGRRVLGHRFRDPALLELALTHRSHGSRHNERLEFLGDSVLGLVVTEALYERFPELPEGRLSRMRASLVRRETLAEVARALDLGAWLRMGAGELRSGGFSRSSTLADALEAVMGALYLDAGLAPARDFIRRVLGDRLAALDAGTPVKDPKTRLQEWLQKRGLPLPVYRVVEVEGPPHRQTFTVDCEVSGLAAPRRARGSSRRQAEQAAAAEALAALEGGHG